MYISEVFFLLKKNISVFILAAIFCILVMYIVIYPNESFASAYSGLQLWFNVVLPALLPFFICVEILIGLGIVSFLGSCFRSVMVPLFRIPGEASFVFFMSIASGYPVGAKITVSLLENKICSQVEAQRILSLCSTSGPLFIIGAVATGILGNPRLGLLLALAHYLSALSAGFIMRFWRNDKTYKHTTSKFTVKPKTNPFYEMLEYRKKDGRSFGILMGDAVKGAINLTLLIGGFIVLFSVITNVLKLSGFLYHASYLICSLLHFTNLNQQAVSSFIVGFLEMTNGIKECAVSEIPTISKLMMISFMMSFGGLSVNAQVLSVIGNSSLSFGLYFVVKLFQGITAAIYTYFLFGFVGIKPVFNVFDSASASQYIRYINSSFISRIGNSTLNLLLVLALMLLFALAMNRSKGTK